MTRPRPPSRHGDSKGHAPTSAGNASAGAGHLRAAIRRFASCLGATGAIAAELGCGSLRTRAYARCRRKGDEAIAALRRAVRLKPDLPDAWRTLADHLTAVGDAGCRPRVRAAHPLFDARSAIARSRRGACENRIAIAEALLRAHLKQHPTESPPFACWLKSLRGWVGMPMRKAAQRASGAGAQLRTGATQLRVRSASTEQAARRWTQIERCCERSAQSGLSQSAGRDRWALGDTIERCNCMPACSRNIRTTPRSG